MGKKEREEINSVYFRDQFHDPGERRGFGANSWGKLIVDILLYQKMALPGVVFYFCVKDRLGIPDSSVEVISTNGNYSLLIFSPNFERSIQSIKNGKFIKAASKQGKYLSVTPSKDREGFFEVSLNQSKEKRDAKSLE